MTAQLQLFMILGAVVLLLIIFAFLKRGLMSVKYSLLWLALAVGLVIASALIMRRRSPTWSTCCATCWTLRCRSIWCFC